MPPPVSGASGENGAFQYLYNLPSGVAHARDCGQLSRGFPHKLPVGSWPPHPLTCETTMTPAEKFTAYMRWLRFIHETHPPLPKGIRRSTLLAYAQAQARDGSYGLNCFASDTRIARELEIKQRGRIAPYRRLVLELGWFVPNGKRDRRVVGLDIAIPKVTESASQAVSDSVSLSAEDAEVSAGQGVSDSMSLSVEDARHDTGTAPGYCAACRPFYARVASGEMTTEQLFKIHES